MLAQRRPTLPRTSTQRSSPPKSLARPVHKLAMRGSLPLRLGPYLLTERLGAGGMACVYKGKRRGAAGFEKQVVVKTLHPELARQPRFMQLFKNEACLSAQLQHNNVVRVNDFGIVDGTPFLEMEYLQGWNLQQVWEAATRAGERLPVSISLTLALEICRGLAYAHSFVDEKGEHRPVVHRDISPANVMICRDGAVKLLDFGLAHLTRGETVKIETFGGKLAYMSPEQLDRRELDRRADVFALGALLHELLTGQRLFGGGDDRQTLWRIQHLPVPPPSQLNPSVPAALDAVVLRALSRDPGQRYQSAADLLSALEAHESLAASRKVMLTHLGSLAPEVFTAPCDACGQRLPCGVECADCRTVADTAMAELLNTPETIVEPPTAIAPPPAPITATAIIAPRRDQVARAFLVLLLTARVWWRQLDAWLDRRRSGTLERLLVPARRRLHQARFAARSAVVRTRSFIAGLRARV